MRYLNGFFFVLFVLFTEVQYNDPDAAVWMVIYGSAAVWAGLATFRLGQFAHNQALLAVFGLCLLAFVGGTIYEWPPSIADWWENELVREGLGMIIATTALIVVAYSLWRTRRDQPITGHASS
jgi:hypothetical protein